MTTVIVALAAALVAAIVAAVLMAAKASAANARLDAAQNAVVQAKADGEAALSRLKSIYETSLERQRADFDNALQRQKIAEAETIQRLEERFSQLAAKALVDNAENLRRQNSNGLEEILKPMRQNIEDFRQTIAQRYDAEARERFSLGERVRELVALNQTIGRETRRLTDALKGNTRLQGAWGEMILDNILDSAGMRRGIDYITQEGITDCEGNNRRPDVVINYSQGRKIVVDSKVSITDYIEMLNADTDDARQTHAAAHVRSVKKHVTELRTKRYADIIDAAYDYVLMFIPHEGAFLAAMNLDPSLWQTAYDSKVIIISPVHLMSILKLIEQMWRQEKQNRNALEIAAQANRLLDKFNGVLDDLAKVEDRIIAARNAHADAVAKLSTGRGNAINIASNIVKLGARTAKPLNPRFTAEADNGDCDISARN